MTFVVKVGGSAGIITHNIVHEIAQCVAEGQRIVVLHGGSDLTNTLSEQLGHPVRMITSPGGMVSRYTDRETLCIYAMAVAGQINTELVACLQQQGVNALGLAGIDGRLLLARRKSIVRSLTPEGRQQILRDDYTGQVEQVNDALLWQLLDAGYTPVIAPLALSREGERLNVDGDRAAAAVAVALQADTLVIMTNVPGLLSDPGDNTTLIPTIPADHLADCLFEQGAQEPHRLLAKALFDRLVAHMHAQTGCRVAQLRIARIRLLHPGQHRGLAKDRPVQVRCGAFDEPRLAL